MWPGIAIGYKVKGNLGERTIYEAGGKMVKVKQKVSGASLHWELG
jgi:hypothetical protein